MQLNVALILSAFASFASASDGECECGIAAIYKVANDHGCNDAACACPNYYNWFGEVDAIIQANCPEQSTCEFTFPL